MIPPLFFDRSHRGTPVGTRRDDGALMLASMLALRDSLSSRHGIDFQDFVSRALSWYRNESYTPDERVFDIGLQTRECPDAFWLDSEFRTPLVHTNGNDTGTMACLALENSRLFFPSRLSFGGWPPVKRISAVLPNSCQYLRAHPSGYLRPNFYFSVRLLRVLTYWSSSRRRALQRSVRRELCP